MQQDKDEHLQKLIAGRDGTAAFASMFEQLLRTTTDPCDIALLTRILSDADQMIAEMNESIDQRKPNSP